MEFLKSSVMAFFFFGVILLCIGVGLLFYSAIVYKTAVVLYTTPLCLLALTFFLGSAVSKYLSE